mmetsp:Transcript_15631/g.34173  ORF Transcript_15631/g.34173 Transcript_15631/m.34173 type:complete len:186 (-) Transcript_15631:274-831(-)
MMGSPTCLTAQPRLRLHRQVGGLGWLLGSAENSRHCCRLQLGHGGLSDYPKYRQGWSGWSNDEDKAGADCPRMAAAKFEGREAREDIKRSDCSKVRMPRPRKLLFQLGNPFFRRRQFFSQILIFRVAPVRGQVACNSINEGSICRPYAQHRARATVDLRQPSILYVSGKQLNSARFPLKGDEVLF